jgi:aspartate carbamoyltransferase catalytic subunit
MDHQIKHCIGLRFLPTSFIESVLNLAQQLKHGHATVNLNQQAVVHVFFEPSTRTRLSFEMATHRCQAFPMVLDIKTSSITKGESLLDMMRNIEALGAKAVIVRHANGGVPHFISQQLTIPVINAGDGYHEHPSQGLLDLFTMSDHLGDLSGKHVLVLGDIMHSRVAKSNIWGLLAMGAKVSVAGPPNLVPDTVRAWGVDICTRLNDCLPTVDAVNVLRIQFERQHGIAVPSIREYRDQFGLSSARQALLPDHAIVLHPGPINRGVELDSYVADGAGNVILEQVSNGVFVRMALLSLLMENSK